MSNQGDFIGSESPQQNEKTRQPKPASVALFILNLKMLMSAKLQDLSRKKVPFPKITQSPKLKKMKKGKFIGRTFKKLEVESTATQM